MTSATRVIGETDEKTKNVSEGYVLTKDGNRLFFQKVGHGPKVVIIPNRIYLFNDFRRLSADRTVIFYDPRNRGRSDQVTDSENLKGGVYLDVEDLEAVRRHFRIEKAALIGHSYLGLMVALYAMEYPVHVERLVQTGATQPQGAKQYPDHLRVTDPIPADVSAKGAEFLKVAAKMEPKEACRQYWKIARILLVKNPADAIRIGDDFCDLPNEWPPNLNKYFNANILPSLQAINLTPPDLAKVTMPTLTIHGTADRNAPYGAGRDWAFILPQARLLTVKGGAHYPWIDAPNQVFGAINIFLNRQWPRDAEKVSGVDP